MVRKVFYSFYYCARCERENPNRQLTRAYWGECKIIIIMMKKKRGGRKNNKFSFRSPSLHHFLSRIFRFLHPHIHSARTKFPSFSLIKQNYRRIFFPSPFLSFACKFYLTNMSKWNSMCLLSKLLKV